MVQSLTQLVSDGITAKLTLGSMVSGRNEGVNIGSTNDQQLPMVDGQGIK